MGAGAGGTLVEVRQNVGRAGGGLGEDSCWSRGAPSPAGRGTGRSAFLSWIAVLSVGVGV